MLPPSSLRPLYFPAILLLVITAVGGSQINDFKSRKLDETDESKCGGCPCSNPCPTPSNPPPPPPPTPCPPPPAPVEPPPSSGYCPPPPAPVKPPPSVYCPPPSPSPPSSSDIIYTTGPPGSLYPVDQTYSIAGDRSSVGALQAVVGGGLVALLMLW